MVMFLLSFVKGVQIRGGESISASGYGPRGSKSAGTKTTKMEDVVSARTRVEVCMRELNQWMLLNNLRLNNGKTELLVLYTKHRPKPPLDSITVGDATVEPTSSARNIGAIFDDTMSSEEHFNDLCKTAFYHIRNISH